MNEPVQAIRMKDEDQIKIVLDKLEAGARIENLEVALLRRYIYLKERQAIKAGRQRKTLKALHNTYLTTKQENRHLRQFIDQLPPEYLEEFLNLAKESLWQVFKRNFYEMKKEEQEANRENRGPNQ